MKTLCFATHNLNKLAEIQLQMESICSIVGLKDIQCFEEIPETQDTIEGNAVQKAQYVLERYGVPCFADDTGLEIDALQGRPGVYSARYAGPGCSPEDNMEKVLQEMSGIQERGAQFKTVLHLCLEKKTYVFTGIVRGKILEHKKGNKGFGYDPIFQPEGYTRTFAEMTMEEKNTLSHRGKATAQLIAFLKQHYSL